MKDLPEVPVSVDICLLWHFDSRANTKQRLRLERTLPARGNETLIAALKDALPDNCSGASEPCKTRPNSPSSVYDGSQIRIRICIVILGILIILIILITLIIQSSASAGSPAESESEFKIRIQHLPSK